MNNYILFIYGYEKISDVIKNLKINKYYVNNINDLPELIDNTKYKTIIIAKVKNDIETDLIYEISDYYAVTKTFVIKN
tara:strand:+ start:3795 stop:4028 length:234 start_codon:yes stop_codon:yes gene_type:complete